MESSHVKLYDRENPEISIVLDAGTAARCSPVLRVYSDQIQTAEDRNISVSVSDQRLLNAVFASMMTASREPGHDSPKWVRGHLASQSYLLEFVDIRDAGLAAELIRFMSYLDYERGLMEAMEISVMPVIRLPEMMRFTRMASE